MSETHPASKHVDRVERVGQWWARLTGQALNAAQKDASDQRRSDRGAIARLKRADTHFEILVEPAAMELIRTVAGRSTADQIRIGELAALLAHVRTNASGQSLAAALGGADPDSRKMKPLRFRRLMLSEPGQERRNAFRRAIAMLKGNVDVKNLTEAWLGWDHPIAGERIRARWALDYATGAQKPEPEIKPLNSQTTAPKEVSL